MDWIKIRENLVRELADSRGTHYDKLDPVVRAAYDLEAMEHVKRIRSKYRMAQAIRYGCICAAGLFLVFVLL